MLFSKLTENKIRALEIKNIADMNILIDSGTCYSDTDKCGIKLPGESGGEVKVKLESR